MVRRFFIFLVPVLLMKFSPTSTLVVNRVNDPILLHFQSIYLLVHLQTNILHFRVETGRRPASKNVGTVRNIPAMWKKMYPFKRSLSRLVGSNQLFAVAYCTSNKVASPDKLGLQKHASPLSMDHSMLSEIKKLMLAEKKIIYGGFYIFCGVLFRR